MSKTKKVKIPKEIMKEIEHLKETGIPRCMKCKKNMVNAYDSIQKKISPYMWKRDCDCYPESTAVLCRG